MPEYLAPGVYVEEVSFRSKSIEGVATSTTGFAGVTGYGPVHYLCGPGAAPRLITSFTEFERVYGSLESLDFTDGTERLNYTAHAARMYFANGGQRLYVSRVFVPGADDGLAHGEVVVDGQPRTFFRARWPGRAGNVVVEVEVTRSRNLAKARKGSVLEVYDPKAATPRMPKLDPTALLVLGDRDPGGLPVYLRDGKPQTVEVGKMLQLLQLRVRVRISPERIDVTEELSTSPDQTRYIGRILSADNPEDETAVVYFDTEAVKGEDPAKLLLSLAGGAGMDGVLRITLAGGNNGLSPTAAALAGQGADPDHAELPATGLAALGDVDDIAIVALPDSGALQDDQRKEAVATLIAHAEQLRYRFAVVDGPPNTSLNGIRQFRGQFDSKYAALYHPWIEILDPLERSTQGAPPSRLLLPPSGFVTGIYARSDVQRGVHKAPANEVVTGLTRLEMNINKGRQDVLNPEGINALRFFEGRGNRIWGARTLSSDPEWMYVNVRRLFIFLEHSIDKGTQWAVFEPNDEGLWDKMRSTVEDFLLVQWRNGALLGSKPAEAYFVRCDRTTMTQNDLDNGRLVCLIGVAPVKPAEFVIFRIGQWTGNTAG